MDIFAILRTGPITGHGHPVLWLAGEEIERCANVKDWFLDVIRITKRRINRIQTAATFVIWPNANRVKKAINS